MRAALVVAACSALLLVAGAAPAAADSLVFAKAGNIFLANADGSGQYQVTLDGSPSSPYESPSQADDGTIVALRTLPGGRPQIWRMTQSGGLLNPPINTPAPGTGAIDARVSPNGQLVAYWFVTTVNDPLCAFCVNIANQALISHSGAFTNVNDVGNPHTGGWPSWMSNNEIVLTNGSGTVWTYTIGTDSEAQQWWGDFANCDMICDPAPPSTLLDAEASRDGTKVAVVRGDNQETIVIYLMTGAPPAVPSPKCGLTGPSGKFQNPTWSQSGQTLAWQENDGIWSIPVDFATCGTMGAPQPALIIPGAAEPDFGPAAVSPGARPGCGNPGNPTPCSGPPGQQVTSAVVKAKLTAFLKNEVKALKKLKIRGLLKKKQLKVTFDAPSAGTLTLKLTTTGAAAKRTTTLASGRLVFAAAGKKKVTLKLTGKGKKVLRHKRKLKGTLTASFTPKGGKATSTKKSVSLKR
ncbi:MAG TPA: hypothetical protein VH817_02540 [Thermoleophilaceae bacterium]